VAVAVLMSLPVMVSALSSGFSLSEDDKKMLQMARVFSFKTAQRIRFIWIPKLKPFFKSGTVSVFGMTWKVVVAGEVLSLPNKAIGTQLSAAQVHLETQEVMALSIVIVALSFAMETLLKLILERNK
jgi:NitT/TauT family transport system permease protein